MVIVELIPTGLWFTEKLVTDYVHSYKVDEILYRGESKYQLIEVIKHRVFGKILFLDRKPQVAEFDEWIYHESLVHPALIFHQKPERILILGGGDGGALREVLKFKSIKKVILVDLDPLVIEIVEKYLPEIPQGAFKDEKVELVYKDGREFIKETDEKFDVIIIDVTDPGSGISSKLFTKEFYQICKNTLKKGGILVTQAESIHFSHFYFKISFPTIVKTLKAVFKKVYPYSSFVPTFASEWGYVLSSDDLILENYSINMLKDKLESIKTRFLTPEKLLSLFNLPQNILHLIEEIGEVITDEKAEELVKKLKKSSEVSEKLRVDELVC